VNIRQLPAGMDHCSTVAAVCLVAIGCLGATPALASASDEEATLSYLRADRQALQGVKAGLPKAELAMNRFVTQTVAECPGVADHAPSGQSLDELKEEALETVSVAGESSVRAALLSLASRIAHLRWSSRRLTRLVRGYATELRKTNVHPPFCSELKEWVAGGYGTLPQSTTRFLKKEASAPGPEDQIVALLTPYARLRAKALLQSVERLELQEAIKALAVALPAVRALEDGLGLRPDNPPFLAGAGFARDRRLRSRALPLRLRESRPRGWA
jgi:hypothetical protein